MTANVRYSIYPQYSLLVEVDERVEGFPCKELVSDVVCVNFDPSFFVEIPDIIAVRGKWMTCSEVKKLAVELCVGTGDV